MLRWWQDYWFRPAPLVDLAVCRIIIVGFQIYLLLSRNTSASIRRLSEKPDSLYDPVAVIQLLTLPFGWDSPISYTVLYGIFWTTVFMGWFALVGYKTNFSLIIFAIGNVMLQAYAYSFGDIHHPEAIMMLALSILALSPAGGVLSIDDWQRRRRLATTEGRFLDFNILDETSHVARWPLLLMHWMYALIYLSACTSKLLVSGLNWMNGYTLQYWMFQDGLRWSKPLGLWLAQFHELIWLSQWVAILFQGTFFLVVFFPFLAWVYVPLGFFFHATVYFTMAAPFFQWMVIYVVFVPWAKAFKIFSRYAGLTDSQIKPEVLFDGKCPLCIRTMTQLRYFDWFSGLTYSNVEEEWPRLAKRLPGTSLDDCLREMYLVLPDGSVRKGFFAFREIVKWVPVLWPALIVFYLPFATTLGQRIYKLVASRRLRVGKCVSHTCGLGVSERPETLRAD